MTKAQTAKLDRRKNGGKASVTYVRDGLNVCMIVDTLEQRKRGGAWRINNEGRQTTGFITPDDRGTFYRFNHIRVDL